MTPATSTVQQSRDPWIVRPKPNPAASLRMFCFPYAGLGTSVFRAWPTLFPPQVELILMQPPGRESRWGEQAFRSAADLADAAVQAIVPLLTPARTVIFKAAHHGSATSSTPPLLDALRPAAAIFSAGRNNRFGHPAVPVVARYRERGVPMFSTADGGAVVIDTDGTEVTIWSWTDPGRRLIISGNRLVDPFFEPGRTGVAREP